jgi:hypothetical protein
MSQNRVLLNDPTGKVVHLVLGWDPPLQEYFCQSPPPESHEADYDWNMHSFSTLQALIIALKDMGLTLPEPVVDALARDRIHDDGSAVRAFNAEGLLLDGMRPRTDA